MCRLQKKVFLDSDWTSDWITTRENQLGDLFNELRKEEHTNSMKNSWPCYNNTLKKNTRLMRNWAKDETKRALCALRLLL